MIPESSAQPAVFEEFFELGLEESVSPFLERSSRRWGINLSLRSSLLAAVLLALSFALSFHPATLPASHFILVLVYFLAGIPSFIDSVEDLAAMDVNIDVLMTLAAFSSVLIGSGFEGGLLLVLFALSGSIEDAVERKAKSAISGLNKLSPTKAVVIEEDGTLIERFLNDVKVNTKILVRSGQLVPLDGIVIEGISSVNLVHLTGESLPIRKQVGDSVAAGARNLEGALVLQVTHTSADSTLSKIIELVTQAQEARPTLQRWFDKLSRSYAITIILLTFFFALTFPIILGLPLLGFEGSLYRALAFLIAASPCALIIAIPIAYLSAISICAKRGILLKGGITLDALAKCHAIAFDKTGTLTTGALTCSKFESLSGSASLDDALSIAYAMERNAVHPIAKAINSYAESKNLEPGKISAFKTLPGYGIEATAEVEGMSLPAYIGHADYILAKLPSKAAETLKKRADAVRESGELLAAMLLGENLYLFQFKDTLRTGIKEILSTIKKRWGWKIVMLTGDHLNSARRVAEETGIDAFYAELRPEDKLKYVSELAEKEGLAMVGDGINDAPALARATVGIGMGKVGSTAALDASDIVLLHDNIELIGWLIGKAKQTEKIVRQNLTVAIGAMLFASIPALAGLVPLWLAVIMHEGGTVLVGLNALRLLRK